MRPRVMFSFVTVCATFANCSAYASVIDSKTGLVLHCRIQTVEHLNCGGGLRVPNETPPDCRDFVSERVMGTNKQNIVLPNKYVRYLQGSGRFSYHNMNFSREGEKIVFSTFPNMYTDAAGYSVDNGVCTKANGDGALRGRRTRQK